MLANWKCIVDEEEWKGYKEDDEKWMKLCIYTFVCICYVMQLHDDGHGQGWKIKKEISTTREKMWKDFGYKKNCMTES